MMLLVGGTGMVVWKRKSDWAGLTGGTGAAEMKRAVRLEGRFKIPRQSNGFNFQDQQRRQQGGR